MNQDSIDLLTQGKATGSQVVVLLGAGRGGTTLLYKLLSLHREVAFLSNYQARMPGFPVLARLQRLVRERHALKRSTWFKVDGGAYFERGRSLLHKVVPAPNECESVYASCGIPLHPLSELLPDASACQALAIRLEAIRRHAGAKVLVTKRTANNRRIAWLEKALPGVRYVKIVRDGRSVASSLMQVEWWRDDVLFWAGKTPRQLMAEGHDELALAARNWVEEVAVIDASLANVPANRVLTIRYEDIVARPRETLGSILSFIGIPPQDDPHFMSVLDTLGLRPVNSPWNKRWQPGQRGMVEHIQREQLIRQGYAV